MSEATTSVAEVFGRAAETYGLAGPDFFEPLGRKLVELAAIDAGDHVLDVAVGAGAVAAHALERGASVVGIDIAAGMVERARARGIDARLMDAQQLDFAAASFDAALSGFGLFFLPRPERGVAELARVLRPGGRLGFSSFVRRDPRWSFVGELLPSAGRPPTADRFEDEASIATLLEGAGFAEVRFVEATHVLVFAGAEEWWAWLWSHGHRGVLERLGAGLDAYKAAVFERVEAMERIENEISARFTLAVRP